MIAPELEALGQCLPKERQALHAVGVACWNPLHRGLQCPDGRVQIVGGAQVFETTEQRKAEILLVIGIFGGSIPVKAYVREVGDLHDALPEIHGSVKAYRLPRRIRTKKQGDRRRRS
ncbi:hypothetical protein ACFQ9X_33585 [Catenulispora yoronensis]